MKIGALKKILSTQGVSGSESKISALLEKEIRPYVDECENDALGNLIAVKRGKGKNAKKIMLCAHMDEVGFLVTAYDKNGFLRCAPIGGIDYEASVYTHLVSETGTRGVLVREEDDDEKKVRGNKCLIDIGAKNEKGAKAKVAIGERFSAVPSLVKLCNGRYAGRPFDDRIGCAVLIDIAEKMAEKDCADDIYYVFSVQEEVGLRGARPASFEIRPDIALVFDVTGTGDVIGSDPMAVSLGGGAAIKIKDSSVICHVGTVEELIQTAKENKIKYQCEILTGGGTDTSSIQMNAAGCRAAAISIPLRYIHTAVETIDFGDVEAVVALALAYLGKRKSDE